MMINVILSTTFNMLCFFIGFFLGINLKKNNYVAPEIKSPAKFVKEVKEEKEAEKINQELVDYLENIDNYPYNQKKF